MNMQKDHEIDKNLITRLSPFTQAVQNAYVEHLRSNANLGFREKSMGIVIDDDNNFLIVQLNGYGESDWNFSGGGLEKGESSEQAVLRELKEELGTNKFKILGKSKKISQYEWPSYVIAKRLRNEGKTWRGQKVRSFLVKFTGKKEDIKPDPGEIRKIKWVKYKELKDYLNFPNQLKETKEKLREFKLL